MRQLAQIRENRMASVGLIVATNNVEDTEYNVVRDILEGAGFDIKVICARDEAVTVEKEKIKTDLKPSDCNFKEFSALIVIGGPGSSKLPMDPILVDLVTSVNGEGGVVGGICLGVLLLARAGVLNKVPATIFPSEKAIKYVQDKGVVYKDVPLSVVDNKITARGPQDAPIFAHAIVEAINRQLKLQANVFWRKVVNNERV